jgi:hypothetical protein
MARTHHYEWDHNLPFLGEEKAFEAIALTLAMLFASAFVDDAEQQHDVAAAANQVLARAGWGMTPDQVVAVSQGQVHLLPPNRRPRIPPLKHWLRVISRTTS